MDARTPQRPDPHTRRDDQEAPITELIDTGAKIAEGPVSFPFAPWQAPSRPQGKFARLLSRLVAVVCSLVVVSGRYEWPTASQRQS